MKNESEEQKSHKTELVYPPLFLSLLAKHTHTLISGLKRNVHPMAAHIEDIDALLLVRDASLILHAYCLTHEP